MITAVVVSRPGPDQTQICKCGYVTGVLRRHRKQIGSKGRALAAGQQALMTLAYLKNAETFAQLGAGFAVGTTTAWRYVNEAVTLLSARSPKLAKALRKATKDGLVMRVG